MHSFLDDEVQLRLLSLLHGVSQAFQKIPGSAILIRYIQNSHQNDPIRSIIELFLVIFFIRYLLSPSYPTNGPNYVKLSEDEIDELVQDWEPEPLVSTLSPLEELDAEKLPIIVGPSGPKVKLSTGKTVINLASYNFYDFNTNEHIKETAVQTLRKYGVGPCSAPLFYGTQDAHITAEADIAAYLGTEACILYAHAFSAISSVIPAFCKRGDIIIADRLVGYSIRHGLDLSRSQIRWFEHNDMDDLERTIKQVIQEQKGKRLTRRFIVTEGLSELVGDCVDLPKLVSLKEKYKFRLILDETWSFGVLGRTGRGLTEAQDIGSSKVDMIVGSLAGPLCSGGGFCCGTRDVVAHQRISAAAYTFSAALPAILAITASETIKLVQSSPDSLSQCRENIKVMRAQLDPRSDWVLCTSSPENPILMLTLKPKVIQARSLSHHDQERLLVDCVEECLNNGVLITRLKTSLIRKHVGSSRGDISGIRAALKVCITSGISKKEMEKAGTVIRHAITKVMTRKSNRQLVSIA